MVDDRIKIFGIRFIKIFSFFANYTNGKFVSFRSKIIRIGEESRRKMSRQDLPRWRV